MKRALIILMSSAVLWGSSCNGKNPTPTLATHNVKIHIDYNAPNIAIGDPEPDPASIAKGDSINWVVSVAPTGATLNVTIDDFKDSSGKDVDVFGGGSKYTFAGVGSTPQNKGTGPAAVISGPDGFKYKITATSLSGDSKILDPRVIVSAGAVR